MDSGAVESGAGEREDGLLVDGVEVWPEGPEVSPVQESVALVTVHSVTLPTFQNTFVVPPLRTSCGRTWRWPVLLPDWMNVIGGRRQMDDPAEQKLGAVARREIARIALRRLVHDRVAVAGVGNSARLIAGAKECGIQPADDIVPPCEACKISGILKRRAVIGTFQTYPAVPPAALRRAAGERFEPARERVAGYFGGARFLGTCGEVGCIGAHPSDVVAPAVAGDRAVACNGKTVVGRRARAECRCNLPISSRWYRSISSR